MSGLISRKEAIDVALTFFVEFLGGAFLEDDQRELIALYEQLPSVQPDVPDTNVGELISRQAAIDLVESFYKIDKSVLNIMVFKLKQLPSVQPETAKRIIGKSRDGMTLWYQCDMCNEPVDVQDNYCRGCGRRLIDE